ncbi:Aste57867_13049 [Aphanomyces stellatus]|uniref:Aste57867_13049 protein n=1 Tax=Aphanomyces stellatus TaxID=120398 RepID=A0A485KXL7_9STRA|nr:hypothetical protein As57867_013001 [Aphanomyces stellatus]VFT89894.1 Aste57867_13049 [Aphanomyces stellatus]
MEARRNQYRLQLLHWDSAATVTSGDGTFVEFRLLNTRVVLKLFDEVPGGALLVFTENLRAHAKAWSTHLVGKFQCKKKNGKKKGICSSWTSGKIYTEMSYQDSNGAYDTCKFLVRVWTQCCRKCNATVSPRMDEDIYNERVVSRLQLWMGLRSPMHFEKQVVTGLPPHRQDLCSACRAGKCQIATKSATKREEFPRDRDHYDY